MLRLTAFLFLLFSIQASADCKQLLQSPVDVLIQCNHTDYARVVAEILPGIRDKGLKTVIGVSEAEDRFRLHSNTGESFTANFQDLVDIATHSRRVVAVISPETIKVPSIVDFWGRMIDLGVTSRVPKLIPLLLEPTDDLPLFIEMLVILRLDQPNSGRYQREHGRLIQALEYTHP